MPIMGCSKGEKAANDSNVAARWKRIVLAIPERMAYAYWVAILGLPLKTYRIVAAAIAWAALALQLYLILMGKSGADFVFAAGNYVSFFTIQANLLAAIAFTLFWQEAPVLRGAVMLYITVTMIIYHVLLAEIWDPQGWQLVANVALHYVVPILYIIDWVFFARKAPLRPRHALLWLIYPAVYGVYTLLRGQITGWYPYPFLDLNMHSYGAVFMNIALLALGLLVLGVFLIALGWIIERLEGDPEMSGERHLPRRPHMSR
jgi:hypothetical protein